MSAPILGIDLGTTTAAVAVSEDGDPRIVPNREGERTTPSVVAVTDSGTYRVGRAAERHAARAPADAVRSITHHLGDPDHTVALGDDEYPPEQVVAMLLRKLVRDAESHLDTEVEKVVVAVPTRFSARQRQAVRDAGAIAEIEVERLIDDTTAATLAYGGQADETVLVYDLGGGTFSVSVVDLGGGVHEVVAVDGDDSLGGEDWDRALVDHLADGFEAEHGIDLREDRQALQRLTEAAEEAKIELSNRRETTIGLPSIAADDDGPTHLEGTITRATFESLTADLLERTVEPAERALSDTHHDWGDIDEVLLVGGATRMPQVRERVEEMTGQNPRRSVNPDEAVALGAAVHGGILSGDVDDVVTLPAVSFPVGIRGADGGFEPLVERNATVPAEGTKTITTASDEQTAVNIGVLQDEQDDPAENDLLGEARIRGIPPAPAGEPRIEITCHVLDGGRTDISATAGDADGVTAELMGGPGRSASELHRLVADLEELTLEVHSEDRIPSSQSVTSPPRRDLSHADLTVEGTIGGGGQAIVRRASLADGPPETVALREPPVEGTLTREAAAAFQSRAEIWETVDARERTKPRWDGSEHVVGVVATGDRQPWLAMEYMDGGDLAELLAEHPDGLPVEQALWLGECICKGIEIAHSLGIAHLDLKPANVLLKETDGWAWPKIADWGLARALANETGTMDGLSVAYAAPEQFDMEAFGEPDELTDIYQIGALVYALLTGAPPVTGGRLEITRTVMGAEPLDPPSTRRPDLSAAVDAAVGVALEQAKTARYDSISEFRKALAAIRTGGRLPTPVAARMESQR
jgi:molecular chaperone DnaK